MTTQSFASWLDDFFASYYRYRPVNATFITAHGTARVPADIPARHQLTAQPVPPAPPCALVVPQVAALARDPARFLQINTARSLLAPPHP